MNPIHKILVPTDLSELSTHGVRYALELAATGLATPQGVQIIFFYVTGYLEAVPYTLTADLNLGPEAPETPVRSVDAILREAHEGLDAFLDAHCKDLIHNSEITQNLTIHHEVDIGSEHEAIVAKANQAQVDLIVMATHGRTGLGHMLSGSVTEQVIRHARCPVLVIPMRAEGEQTKA